MSFTLKCKGLNLSGFGQAWLARSDTIIMLLHKY